MVNEEEIKSTPPRIGDFGTRLDAEGKVEVFWFVENADTVEIPGLLAPCARFDDSLQLKVSKPTDVTLIAKNSQMQVELTIRAQTQQASRVPARRASKLKNATLYALPDGSSHGYLIENPTPQKEIIEPDQCPICKTKADDWVPPVGDQKYDATCAILKSRLGNVSDYEVHAEFLRKTGGYVASCSKCSTSFFVAVKR